MTISTAKQGHRYRHGEADVLALESGRVVRVAELVPGQPWLGRPFTARAERLQPLPMRYFHGETGHG